VNLVWIHSQTSQKGIGNFIGVSLGYFMGYRYRNNTVTMGGNDYR